MDHDQIPTDAGSDRSCIEASLTRPDAFEAVFRRHHPTIHAYLARRSDRAVADDLAGEVFCRAFRARDRFDDRSKDAIPWLIGFARNVLHERRRAAAREQRHLGRAATDPTIAYIHTNPSDESEPDEPIADRRDELRQARAALAQLPETLAEPLLLFVWEHLTYAEIADALGIPVGTVRSRIARSRARWAERLARSGQDPCEAATVRKAMP